MSTTETQGKTTQAADEPPEVKEEKAPSLFVVLIGSTPHDGEGVPDDFKPVSVDGTKHISDLYEDEKDGSGPSVFEGRNQKEARTAAALALGIDKELAAKGEKATRFFLAAVPARSWKPTLAKLPNQPAISV